MHCHTRCLVLSCACWLACARAPAAEPHRALDEQASRATDASSPLRLVVQITVDQLRADFPERILARVPAGGFRRLYEQGVVYEQAHYTHAITETAPGHATLFTGAHPAEHGVIANEWLSPSGEPVYVVDDASTKLLGSEREGASPRKLLLATIGDALREQTGEQALVYAVSEKDRGAVLPAGRKGKAFWLDDQAGGFVTSSYYMQDLPAWLRTCSESLEVSLLRGQSWSLLQDDNRYLAPDDLESEIPGAGERRTFPHLLEVSDIKVLTREVKNTPSADTLVLDFVRELLIHEPIGRDDVPDLLSVSFSATDYIGHRYGPESREAEDNLLRLDRTLAALFALLEQRIGMARTLAILSADHGISESPEWLRTQGKPAGRHDTQALVADLNRDLRAALHVDVDLVRSFVNPSIWLHEPNIAAAKLTVARVAAAAAEIVRRREGVAAAFTRDDVLAGKLDTQSLAEQGTRIGQAVTASIHPERSGHVYVVPSPNWLLASDEKRLTAMHGTPWDYDSHVPIVVLGPGLRAQRVTREVDPRSIAPTLARWLDLPTFSSSNVEPLSESVPARSPR